MPVEQLPAAWAASEARPLLVVQELQLPVESEQHPVPAFLVRGQAGSHGASYIDARPGCTPPPARRGAGES